MKRSKRIAPIAYLIVLLLAAGALEAAAQTTRRSTTSNRSSTSQRSTRAGYGASSLGQAHFEIDTETGQLIVITDSKTNLNIKELVAKLDRPVPQVLIKVLFLEVTHGKDIDIGSEFAHTDTKTIAATDTKAAYTETDIVSSLFDVAAAAAVDGGGTWSILREDLTATLHALGQTAKLEVLSRPSILARNNIEAVFSVGQEVPFVTYSQITSQGNTINSINYEDIGIILAVTPRITETKEYRMAELDISTEISTLTGDTVKISETVNAPVFAKRSAQTVVVVPDGKTIVIGGLMENQMIESVRKVPWLGDIWGLGFLFSRTIKTEAKTELLIFLTPQIVKTTREIHDMTMSEKNDTVIMPEAFTEDDLDRFMPDLDNTIVRPQRNSTSKPSVK